MPTKWQTISDRETGTELSCPHSILTEGEGASVSSFRIQTLRRDERPESLFFDSGIRTRSMFPPLIRTASPAALRRVEAGKTA